MSITKKEFGKLANGEKVYSYTLDNGKGLSAEILNYGGVVRTLCVTGKDGKAVDVVLGYDTIEDYVGRAGYYGALIGRNSNRISNSAFVINGKEYKINPNEGNNNLHGGIVGFDKKIWDVIEDESTGEPSVVLSLTSPDGDEGFPGSIDVTVTYTVTNNNSLVINYSAKSDEDTICNMTNHSYFNLSGHNSGQMIDQTLWMDSKFYTPNDAECMPVGEIISVKGTPFDFTTAKPIGQDITSEHEQIKMFNGYDHNFVLSGTGYRLCAKAHSEKTGISMEMYTNQPGVQLYTCDSPEVKDNCKDGASYGLYQAFCLETQCFPNAMAFSHYPSIVLKKNNTYEHVTEYKFTCED